MAKRRTQQKDPTPAPAKAAPPAPAWKDWLPKALLIAAVTVWIYWPALRGGFIWDDGWYIPKNALLQSPNALGQFWFHPGSWVEYYPIHETLLWLQWQLFGTDTFGYHLTNVVLHIVSALLIWRLLAKFGLSFAWLGGLIFAAHPAQVESVAYISEMKNALCLPFLLLAMGAWVDYENERRGRDYALALVLFAAAMLSKIAVAPFPAIILLYAWWKRGRIDFKDALASAPFFIVALTLGRLSLWAGQQYEAGNLPEFVDLGGIFSRLAGAGHILAFYVGRAFLPVDYLPAYPKWPVSPFGILPWLVVAAAFFFFWLKRQGWGRHAILGFGFFLVMLGPFLGLTAVSFMTFTWVMDHFLYIPLIGMAGLMVAGLDVLEARWPKMRSAYMGAVTVAVALMAMESHAFANLFTNDETLWRYTLLRYPDTWIAHQNLGVDLVDHGKYEEAIPHYAEVQRLNPGDSDAYYNMGGALEKLGRKTEARDQYRRAVELNPGDAKAQLALANMLMQTGDRAGAIKAFEQAIKYIPNVAQIRYDLGVLHLQAGEFSAAVEQLQAAVRLDPKLLPARENLGSALAQAGRVPEAIEQFQAALQLEPRDVNARNNLAFALSQTGHVPEAIEQYRKVLEIEPGNARAVEGVAKLQKK